MQNNHGSCPELDLLTRLDASEPIKQAEQSEKHGQYKGTEGFKDVSGRGAGAKDQVVEALIIGGDELICTG